MYFHVWHTLFSLFFAALVGLGIAWLHTAGRLSGWVPVGDFFLMALAIYRLIHLFTYDHITAFIRDWFVGYDGRTFMGTLGTLINCQWCTGLWFAFVVVFAYFATPFAWYAILILALSALGSFFQAVSSLVGWSAEAKKREAQGIALPR